MRVGWAVDEYPVRMQWSDAPMRAPGGYGSLGEVSCPREDWPLSAGAFSTVVGTRQDGRVLYVGEVAGPPRTYQGSVRFNVQGIVERMARQRGRRLYQSRDMSEWALSDADPFSAGTYPMHPDHSADVGGGALIFKREPVAQTSGNRISASMWAGDEIITRVAFNIWTVVGQASHEIRILTAAGPDGTATAEGTVYNLAGAVNLDVDRTLSNPNTMVQIEFRASATTAAPNRGRTTIRNLRVNGRTTADTFSLGELTADIAAAMDWDDVSVNAGGNVLPQDWTDNWPDAFTGACDLSDSTWLTLPPITTNAAASLYAGPWGRHTWDVKGADYTDLQPQVIYNKAVVASEAPGGFSREVEVLADPDPYAGEQVIYWPPDGPFQLDDAQYDDAQPRAAAEALIAHYATSRVAGQIALARVWGQDGEAHPWDIDAGDLVRLTDYEVSPGTELPAQRVVETTRRQDGTAVISVSEDTSLGALLEDVEPRRRRHRKRRKKRKRKHK